MANEKQINARMQQKHDIEANWLKSVYNEGIKENGLKEKPFIPKAAEIIVYDIDDNYSYPRFKIGDGIHNIDELPFSNNEKSESGALVIEGGLATEGCVPLAIAGSAIGIETTSGSKSYTIWGLGEGSTVDANEGIYLIDGITATDDEGNVYIMEVGDEYSSHVCYTNSNGNGSRQRSFYGKITAINETELNSPAGKPLYAITVNPFFGIPSGSTFRPFLTNEDGTISELEDEYLDKYGVDQERNTFRIPAKHLLGDRILGAYAYATGYQSTANTRGGFTAGRDNIADGNYGSALGYANKAAYAAFGTGVGTKAIGIKSFTQGANTEAYQEAASAMGVRTKVDGFGAHGTGIDVTVNGRGAQGEGISNKISGNAAHGEGQNVEVDGVAAHGEGDNTNAIGPATHSEGKNTLAGMKWTKATVVEGTTAFELDKEIDGFAVNDVYSIIQTNFDTSYIDAGKITSIDGRTINVDILPSFKDAKTAKETVTREVCIVTFDTVVNADGDIDIILNFSTPLSVRVGLPLIYGAYYGDTYTSLGEGATQYFEVGTVSEHITTFPDVWSDGTPFTKAEVGFAMWDADDGVVVPDGYDYEIPEVNTFKLLKSEQITVSQAVYYFGVRKKPTIGAQTLGEAIHVEGRDSNALYTGAHAGGQGAIASSSYTFAHGAVAKATSRHAIALGDHAEAKDAFSAAIGQYAKTGRANQVAIGKYNAENPNAVFVVGWGTGDSDDKRKNIFEVDINGNAYANGKQLLTTDTNTTYDLYASKNSTNGNVTIQLDPSTGANDNIKIQGSGSTTVTTDANGVITIKSTVVDTVVEWSEIENKPNIKVGTYVNAKGETVPKTTAVTIGNVVAENIANMASGDGAVSVGRGTRALSNSSFAAGINTIAQGRNTLTTGDKGIAWSDNTFVSGSGTLYNGTFTNDDLAAIETAWLNGTTYHIAANNRAAVFGQSNYAKGESSFVIGQRNKANYKNQFVTGQFNNYNSNALFMVGDGTGNSITARSNAFEVFGKNGSTPACVKVGGKIIATEDFVKASNNIAKTYNDYSSMISALNAMSNDELSVGQNIYLVALNIPDLWVSAIDDTKVSYTYISDNALIEDLEDGTIQIGYYILSKLETQKVDLTNYATKSDLNNYVTQTEFNAALGDIEASLNAIIAIQNQILGG